MRVIKIKLVIQKKCKGVKQDKEGNGKRMKGVKWAKAYKKLW